MDELAEDLRLITLDAESDQEALSYNNLGSSSHPDPSHVPGDTAEAGIPVQFDLPEDIIRMIFTEYLSKPGIHFAEVRFSHSINGCLLGLMPLPSTDPEAADPLKSSYRLAQTLNATSKLAQDCVRRATHQPSTLDYGGGRFAPIDSAKDLLCFILGGMWSPVFVSNTNQSWGIRSNHAVNAETMGHVHHAGVAVTTAMWHQVLRRWFDPTLRAWDFATTGGWLLARSLVMMMTSTKELEEFAIVLIDVSPESWDNYYKNFPITFHDHTGSYVEVDEQYLKHDVVESLWHPTIDLDIILPPERCERGFAIEVDSWLTDKQRVQILLGLLQYARFNASALPDMKDGMKRIKLSVLARKPDVVADQDTASRIVQTPPKTEAPIADKIDDLEDSWINQEYERNKSKMLNILFAPDSEPSSDEDGTEDDDDAEDDADDADSGDGDDDQDGEDEDGDDAYNSVPVGFDSGEEGYNEDGDDDHSDDPDGYDDLDSDGQAGASHVASAEDHDHAQDEESSAEHRDDHVEDSSDEGNQDDSISENDFSDEGEEQLDVLNDDIDGNIEGSVFWS